MKFTMRADYEDAALHPPQTHHPQREDEKKLELLLQRLYGQIALYMSIFCENLPWSLLVFVRKRDVLRKRLSAARGEKPLS
jgi:hypothetical protein